MSTAFSVSTHDTKHASPFWATSQLVKPSHRGSDWQLRNIWGEGGVLSLLLLRTFCSYILCSKVRFLSFNLVLVVSNVIKWTRNKHTKIIYSLLSCFLFPSTQQFFFPCSFSGHVISGPGQGAPALALQGTGCSWGHPSRWGLMGSVDRCEDWHTNTHPSDRGETSCTETQMYLIIISVCCRDVRCCWCDVK